MICLAAHYTTLISGEKDHEQELLDRGFTRDQIKTANAKRMFFPTEILGLKFSVPITRFKSSKLSYLLVLLDNYERGNLPHPGSISEQPAQLMDMIHVLQNIKIKMINQASSKSEKPKTRR